MAWNLASIVIGLVGIALAAVFYAKSKNRPGPAFRRTGFTVVGNADAVSSDIEVRFRHQVVDRVSSTTVFFWNDGNATIHSNSVAARDPLRIELTPGSRLLSAEIERRSREVTGVSLSRLPGPPDAVAIKFEFLDPGDGVRINLLHTAHWRDAHVVGTVVGVPSGLRTHDPAHRPDPPPLVRLLITRRREFALGAVLTGAIGVVTAAVGSDELIGYLATYGTTDVWPSRLILGAVSLPYMLFGYALWRKGQQRYPTSIGYASRPSEDREAHHVTT